jgi:hypothetical protein
MFVCGSEEPAGVNEQLCGLDESTGELVPDAPASTLLNRYSFLWLGPQDAALVACCDLLRWVGRELAAPSAQLTATWCELDDGSVAARAAVTRRAGVLRSERLAAGWQVTTDGLLTVATYCASEFPASEVTLEDLRALAMRRLLVSFGRELTPDELLSPLLLPVLSRFARSRSLGISTPVVRSLEADGPDIAYPHRDVLGRVGLVLLTRSTLPIPDLSCRGTVSHIATGVDAPRVWQVGPSGFVPAEWKPKFRVTEGEAG